MAKNLLSIKTKITYDPAKTSKKMVKGYEAVDKSMHPVYIKDIGIYMYKDTGDSIKNMKRVSKPGLIINSMPYDKKNYYGVHLPKKEKNPLATPFWFEASKKANVKKWEFTANKFLKGRGL